MPLPTPTELLRPRDAHAHKGDHGTLTLLCGSRFYRGAAALATESALRSGVGIVRLASIECVIAAVAPRSPEAIFFPMEEASGTIAPSLDALLTEKSTALLCGCGCMRTKETLALTQSLLARSDLPLLLDAGALTALADAKAQDHLKRKLGETVVTPHVGEMAALCELPIAYVAENMEQCATDFAHTYRCITVLKSYRTVIATPAGTVWESCAAHHGLARGGSGDVLAGAIASFLAQGYAAEQSALLGVWLHAAASQLLAHARGERAMLPRELPDYFGAAFGAFGRT